MSELYQLTQKIHKLLPQINQKYGLEVKIAGRFYYSDEDHIFYYNFDFPEKKLKNCIRKLESDQIRQILVGLQHLLGIKADKFEKKNLCLVHDKNGNLILPLFDREPKTVLQELVEILEKKLRPTLKPD